MPKRIEISSCMWECAHCGKQHENEVRARFCETAFERRRLFKSMFIPDQLNWYEYRRDDVFTRNFDADKQQDVMWVLGYEMQEHKHYINDYPYGPEGSCMQTYCTIYNANRGQNAIDYLYQPLQRLSLMDGLKQKGLFPTMNWIRSKTYKQFSDNQKRQIKDFWAEAQAFVDAEIRDLTLGQIKNLCVIKILQSYIDADSCRIQLPQYYYENAMNWTFQFPMD